MTQWYVQDRTSLSGYANVKSDAASIEAIGTVFPMVFFVVAILISLTTITRMVEEDRYCLDVSSQIMAAQSILKKANRMVLRAHMDCCVREAAASGDPDAKLEELAALLDKLAD